MFEKHTLIGQYIPLLLITSLTRLLFFPLHILLTSSYNTLELAKHVPSSGALHILLRLHIKLFP